MRLSFLLKRLDVEAGGGGENWVRIRQKLTLPCTAREYKNSETQAEASHHNLIWCISMCIHILLLLLRMEMNICDT